MSSPAPPSPCRLLTSNTNNGAPATHAAGMTSAHDNRSRHAAHAGHSTLNIVRRCRPKPPHTHHLGTQHNAHLLPSPCPKAGMGVKQAMVRAARCCSSEELRRDSTHGTTTPACIACTQRPRQSEHTMSQDKQRPEETRVEAADAIARARSSSASAQHRRRRKQQSQMTPTSRNSRTAEPTRHSTFVLQRITARSSDREPAASADLNSRRCRRGQSAASTNLQDTNTRARMMSTKMRQEHCSGRDAEQHERLTDHPGKQQLQQAASERAEAENECMTDKTDKASAPEERLEVLRFQRVLQLLLRVPQQTRELPVHLQSLPL